MLRPAPSCALALVLAGPCGAAAQNALIPQRDQDFSASRVDCDVFGWNSSYTEMAAVGSNVRRYPLGKQRGEAFLLVYEVGELEPTQNVHVDYITQADMPHDPLPMEDVRDRMWVIDEEFQHMWPRRPLRKHFKGAMTFTAVWEPLETQPGVCKPTVGFRLEWQGEKRYQPHVPMRFEAPCASLVMSDYRSYWAKKDLGAVMIRFDYSPTPNEQSVRVPLAVAWRLAHTLRLELRTDGTLDAGRLAKVLDPWGKVTKTLDPAARGAPRVAYRTPYRQLAANLAHELRGELGDDLGPLRDTDEDLDLIVTAGAAGPASGGAAAAPGPRPPAAARPPSGAAPKAPPAPPAQGSYLDDFKP